MIRFSSIALQYIYIYILLQNYYHRNTIIITRVIHTEENLKFDNSRLPLTRIPSASRLSEHPVYTYNVYDTHTHKRFQRICDRISAIPARTIHCYIRIYAVARNTADFADQSCRRRQSLRDFITDPIVFVSVYAYIYIYTFS